MLSRCMCEQASSTCKCKCESCERSCNKHTGHTEAWRGLEPSSPSCPVPQSPYRAWVPQSPRVPQSPFLKPTATEVSFRGYHHGYRSHPLGPTATAVSFCGLFCRAYVLMCMALGYRSQPFHLRSEETAKTILQCSQGCGWEGEKASRKLSQNGDGYALYRTLVPPP